MTIEQLHEAIGKVWIMNLMQWVCIIYLMFKRK